MAAQPEHQQRIYSMSEEILNRISRGVRGFLAAALVCGLAGRAG
jgi:hypothetical protein